MRRCSTPRRPRLVPLDRSASLRFAGDEPHAGETGVVVAYAIRHRGRRAPVRHRLRVRQRRARAYYQRQGAPCRLTSWPRPASRWTRSTPSSNCHLHVDHAGQNSALPRHPDLRPAGRMGDRPHDRLHDPRVDRLPRAPTTSRSPATTSPSDGIRILRHARPHARPPVARRRDARRATSSSPARPSTRRGEWAGDPTPARADRGRRISRPTTARSRG